MSRLVVGQPEWLDLDVLVPAWRTVILQTDVAGPGMVLVSDVKLVLRTVRTTVGGCPLVEVHLVDAFAVQLDGELRSIASDHHMVPLPDWLHGVFRWFDQVVKCAGVVKKSGLGVVDRDLDAVEADILTRPGVSGYVRMKTPLLQPLLILKSSESTKSAQVFW